METDDGLAGAHGGRPSAKRRLWNRVLHPDGAPHAVARRLTEASPAFAFFADRLPTGFDFSPAHGTYHDVLYMRTFFFRATLDVV